MKCLQLKTGIFPGVIISIYCKDLVIVLSHLTKRKAELTAMQMERSRACDGCRRKQQHRSPSFFLWTYSGPYSNAMQAHACIVAAKSPLNRSSDPKRARSNNYSIHYTPYIAALLASFRSITSPLPLPLSSCC